jgi:hypothetical protein
MQINIECYEDNNLVFILISRRVTPISLGSNADRSCSSINRADYGGHGLNYFCVLWRPHRSREIAGARRCPEGDLIRDSGKESHLQ